MNADAFDDPAQRVWSEAAATVQADHDADVHDEARGLLVAEMADVTLVDRLSAAPHNSSLEVRTTTGRVVTGRVRHTGRDYLALQDQSRMIVLPLHAVAIVEALPTVVHDDGTEGRTSSWRRVFRRFLGSAVQVETGDRYLWGVLTWVGHDHFDLRVDGGNCTVVWHAVTAVVASVGAGES